MTEQFSDAVRRFVLTSIPTVPHIETLLLLWRERQESWTAELIARRLFIAPAHAQSVADELRDADLLEAGEAPGAFRCRQSEALASLLAELDLAYSRHLRAITALIHSKVERKAARFAQDFTWDKKK